MSKAGWVIMIIVIILITFGALITLYFLAEKPKIDPNIVNNTLVELNVAAFSNDTHEQLATGYLIIDSNLSNQMGGARTITNGRSNSKIINNQSVYVVNNNLEGQNYYTSALQYDINYYNQQSIRVDLPVKVPGNLTVSHTGELLVGTQINLSVSNSRYFQDLLICVRWSSNFLNVRGSNLTQVAIPQRLANKVDKCLATNVTIYNATMTIPLEVNRYSPLTTVDSLTFYIVDMDTPFYSLSTPIVEGRGGVDLGVSDYVYQIKTF